MIVYRQLDLLFICYYVSSSFLASFGDLVILETIFYGLVEVFFYEIQADLSVISVMGLEISIGDEGSDDYRVVHMF